MKTVPLLPYPIGNHLSDKARGGDRTSAQGGFIGKGDIELLKFVGKQIIQLEIKKHNTIVKILDTFFMITIFKHYIKKSANYTLVNSSL